MKGIDLQLFQVVGENSVEKVQVLLSQGANPNALNEQGRTALHHAAYKGHEKVIEFLLGVGKADVNIVDNSKNTALHLAAKTTMDIVGILIQAGSKVDAIGNHNLTPLHIAAMEGKKDIVQLLMNNKADDELKDEQGNTALHWAALKGHKKVIDILLDYGESRIEIVNDDGDTPLHLAVAQGHKDLVELLFEQNARDISHIKNNNGKTVLDTAKESKNSEIYSLLSEPYSNFKEFQRFQEDKQLNLKNEELINAVKEGNIPLIKKLLRQGANINNTNGTDGLNPLHMAILDNNFDVAKFLLEKGADINPRNTSVPPLVTAIEWRSSIDILELLFNRGANINYQDPSENSLLHYAVGRANLIALKFLIKKGCDVNLKDDNGDTALHLAIASGYDTIVNILWKCPNINKEAKNLAGETPIFSVIDKAPLALFPNNNHNQIFKYLASNGANIYAKNFKGIDLSLKAVMYRELDILRELITFKLKDVRGKDGLVDISNATKNGKNVLHIAAILGRTEILEYFFKISKIIKDFNVLINARNNDGTNPLGMVFLFSEKYKDSDAYIKAIKLFIDEERFEINSYLNNKKGQDYQYHTLNKIGGFNCLHMALIYKQPEILKLLKGRNDKLTEKYHFHETDAHVNFRYPALNPKFHMCSPEALREKNPLPKKQLEDNECRDLLAEYHDSPGGSIDSGDSDDSSSSAYIYKKALLELDAFSEQNKGQNLKVVKENSQSFIQLLATSPKDKKISNEEEIELGKFHEKTVIPHFHGVPFMEGALTNSQRREVGKKLININSKSLKLMLGENVEKLTEEEQIIKSLHSRTSTTSCGIENLYHLIKAPLEKLQQLKKIDEILGDYLARCYQKDKAKFLEILNKYIYFFSSSPIKEVWEELLKIEKADPSIIKYRFGFLSTSKAADHAAKFGIGKNVEETVRDEKPLNPKYDSTGYPKHRLAGFLYITIHDLSRLESMEHEERIADITRLLTSGQLKSSKERTNHQIECTFFGGVSYEDVALIIPIIYPNFSKGFKLGYHDKLWGLDNKVKKSTFYFDKAKKYLSNNEEVLYKEGKITPKGMILMSSSVKFVLKVVEGVINSLDKNLCYMSPDGTIKPYPLEYVTKLNNSLIYLSKAQLDMRDHITSPKNSKIPKTKISPEDLNAETYSRKFSLDKGEEVPSPLKFDEEMEDNSKETKEDFYDDNNTGDDLEDLTKALESSFTPSTSLNSQDKKAPELKEIESIIMDYVIGASLE